MKNKFILKIILGGIVFISIIFIINVFKSIDRVGNYSISKPYEELTFTEKTAAKLCGYKFDYISEEDTILCNYSKKELETMYINSEKYIGASLKFTGPIMNDIGFYDMISNEEVLKIISESDYDSIVFKIINTDVLVTVIYPKDKIDYKKWTKGTKVSVEGYIKEIKKDHGTSILLEEDSNISIED